MPSKKAQRLSKNIKNFTFKVPLSLNKVNKQVLNYLPEGKCTINYKTYEKPTLLRR